MGFSYQRVLCSERIECVSFHIITRKSVKKSSPTRVCPHLAIFPFTFFLLAQHENSIVFTRNYLKNILLMFNFKSLSFSPFSLSLPHLSLLFSPSNCTNSHIHILPNHQIASNLILMSHLSPFIILILHLTDPLFSLYSLSSLTC